jgi:hypothetical protein
VEGKYLYSKRDSVDFDEWVLLAGPALLFEF